MSLVSDFVTHILLEPALFSFALCISFHSVVPAPKKRYPDTKGDQKKDGLGAEGFRIGCGHHQAAGNKDRKNKIDKCFHSFNT